MLAVRTQLTLYLIIVFVHYFELYRGKELKIMCCLCFFIK